MSKLFMVIGWAGLVVGCLGTARADNLDEPTHTEIDPIKFDIGPEGKIETMGMDSQGRLLCGVSWIPKAPDSPAGPEPASQATQRPPLQPSRRRPRGPRPGDVPQEKGREYAIKVVDEQGKVLATWPMKDVKPKMIHGCDDGTIYVGGHGKLGRFSSEGKPLQVIETSRFLDGQYKEAEISGLTANDKYFFVAFGNGFSLRTTEDIVRFHRDFSQPKLIVEKQFGCCSHLDLDTKGDLLLIAENSRHRVNRFSFEGERHDTWGRRDRQSLEGFAACCNPVNFDFGPGGVLYTAESGIGRVKKYSAEGKYLGMVGYVDTTEFDRGSRLAAQSCYIPVEVNLDASRIFVMDVRAHVIRVLAQKAAKGDTP